MKIENPEMRFTEITKLLGQEWSTMDADKKQVDISSFSVFLSCQIRAFLLSKTVSNGFTKKLTYAVARFINLSQFLFMLSQSSLYVELSGVEFSGIPKGLNGALKFIII